MHRPRWVQACFGRNTLAAILLLALSVWTVTIALSFGSEARRLPLLVGVPLVILAAISVVMEARRAAAAPRERVQVTAPPGVPLGGRAAERPTPVGRAAGTTSRMSEDETSGALRTIPRTLAHVGIFFAIILLLGLYVGGWVYGVAFTRRFGRMRWWQAVLGATLVVGLLWVTANTLNLRTFHGYFAPLSQQIG